MAYLLVGGFIFNLSIGLRSWILNGAIILDTLAGDKRKYRSYLLYLIVPFGDLRCGLEYLALAI